MLAAALPDMPLDPRLLDVLCCPVSRVPVTPLTRERLAELNRRIEAGGVLDVAGGAVAAPLKEALITIDDKVIYRIDDGIPVMLAEEGIGTTQFDAPL